MKDLSENNVVKFKNLSKKKGVLFANFSVRGIRGGVVISSTISVDISALELHPTDPLEKIIEECARKAIKEFKRAEFQFEDSSIPQEYLGVAQLG